MIYLFALVLGIVQGAMEFLPVSSSGHIVLISRWFNISETLTLSIILHIATLLSVVIVFRRQIWELIKHPFSSTSIQIYISTAATVLIAVIFKKFIEESFGGAILPYCFLITAVLLLITQFVANKIKIGKQMSNKTALMVGLAQGIAILPGISRSGATICAALLNKTDRKESADFSFIISLPIIIGSGILDVIKIFSSGDIAHALPMPPLALALAFVSAFVVGLVCVKLMRKLTEKNILWPFSIYLVLIAILSFVF